MVKVLEDPLIQVLELGHPPNPLKVTHVLRDPDWKVTICILIPGGC